MTTNVSVVGRSARSAENMFQLCEVHHAGRVRATPIDGIGFDDREDRRGGTKKGALGVICDQS
ncbi:hypothetical protein ACRAWD_12580 [Caulobacter segnis]